MFIIFSKVINAFKNLLKYYFNALEKLTLKEICIKDLNNLLM